MKDAINIEKIEEVALAIIEHMSLKELEQHVLEDLYDIMLTDTDVLTANAKLLNIDINQQPKGV